VGEKRIAYRFLLGKPQGKRPLRSKLEDNIKMGPREIGWEDMNCIHLIRDREELAVFL
jgi:hypothetical protein